MGLTHKGPGLQLNLNHAIPKKKTPDELVDLVSQLVEPIEKKYQILLEHSSQSKESKKSNGA